MSYLHLFAREQRDIEHEDWNRTIYGTIDGYLSIRNGYLQFHYSKEDWMLEEVSVQELSAELNKVPKNIS